MFTHKHTDTPTHTYKENVSHALSKSFPVPNIKAASVLTTPVANWPNAPADVL